jgi:hypothetical protein
MKRIRSIGKLMDEKNVGLMEEPVSKAKAVFDPSPRKSSAFVNGEGSQARVKQRILSGP